MPSFTEIASRLYRQLLGLNSAPLGDEHGITTLLEGTVAVATVEAILSEVSASGESFPPEHGSIAWRGEQQRQQLNLFGQPLLQLESESPRAALSNAMGLVMAGKRTSCSLWSSDLAAAQDLLRRAVGHHLPLVVHTINRALPLQGESSEGSHQAIHQLRESGACILFAQNVQQAIDFTLIAHAVAEQALLPVVVAMDGEETAFAMQKVQLPSPQLIQQFVGQSSDHIKLDDPAQKMLFGESRRRIPCWHNLDRPTLQGAYQDQHSFGLGEISHTQFFGRQLEPILEQAFSTFYDLTERDYGALSYQGEYKSLKLIVAQGAITERLQQIVDHLNREQRGEMAVIGLQQIAPAPTRALRKLLQRADQITVLDRVEPLLDDEPPLYRQVITIASSSCRVHSVLYGMGGLPVHNHDLLAACQLPVNRAATTLRLGVDPLPNHNNPKQQVQQDQLERHYPDLSSTGLRGNRESRLSIEDGLTVAILHRNHAEQRNYCGQVAQQLYHATENSLRSQQQSNWSEWGESRVDCFRYSASPLLASLDPEQPIDIALLSGHQPQQGIPAIQRLHSDSQLLIDPGSLSRDEYLAALPIQQVSQLKQLGVALFFILYSAESREDEAVASAQRIGTLFHLITGSEAVELRESRLIEQYHPQQQRESFEAALGERLQPYALQQPAERNEAVTQQTPMAVRHLGHSDDALNNGYQNLSRFWDQTGVLYRDGLEALQSVDPFIATGQIPPLSSTFNNHSNQSATLPQFNAASCSGCGECWSHCPDSAIGATSLTPSQLLEAGMKMGGADALRPHLSKLSKVLSTLTESGPSDQLIQQGWTTLMEQAPLAEERRATADEAVATLCKNLGSLPVAHTQPLFHQLEAKKPQAGELLALVINPDSCKGCGICTTLCAIEAEKQGAEVAALTQQHSDTSALNTHYNQWRSWEQLPDTSSNTLIEFGARPEIGALTATLLSRYAAMAVAGGDHAEPGSGEKLVVRQLLGITEYRQQPLVQQQLQELETLYKQLMEGIREQLAAASHIDDLAALAEGLDDLSNRNLTLSTLAEKTAGIESEGIDAYALKEWIELAEAINQEQQQIAAGDQSLGRARYSLAFASGTAATWAGTFPFNPFQVPVTIGSAAEIGALASGLMEGQLEQATTTHRLIHKAKNLLKNGAEAERKEMDRLTWRDLSDDEQQQCAPLLLIGNDTTLGAAASGGLSWLLNSDLPIKVIVLAEMDLGFAGESGLHGANHRHSDARSELALAALAQRNAYVAQSSIANPEHLNHAMREALQYNGPALLRIHAPSPQRHGFASDQTLAQANRAVTSRAFPLFRYSPDLPGVFGTRITLEGNTTEPDTIASWAFHEQRFAGLFTALDGDKGPTPLEQWITLDSRGQNNKTPTCTVDDGEYAIDSDFARRLGQLLQQWQMLQELAGVVTPFTEQVQQQAETRIAASHQAEVDALKQAHQQELQTLREQLEDEVTTRITGQLSALVESYSDTH